MTSPGEMTERLVSLNQVFMKLVEKFPKRLYERVKDTEIGDQPADDSTFTLWFNSKLLKNKIREEIKLILNERFCIYWKFNRT